MPMPTSHWFDPGTTALLLAILSTAVAVLLHHVTARTGLRFLFERPAWASLPERRKATKDTRSRPLHS